MIQLDASSMIFSPTQRWDEYFLCASLARPPARIDHTTANYSQLAQNLEVHLLRHRITLDIVETLLTSGWTRAVE